MTDITAWLGDTETTADQRDRLARAADDIDARFPVPADGEPADVAEEREAALTAAAQLILGDTTIDEAGDAYVSARRRAELHNAAWAGAVIAAVQTETKIDIHRRTGISRPAIDRALG